MLINYCEPSVVLNVLQLYNRLTTERVTVLEVFWHLPFKFIPNFSECLTMPFYSHTFKGPCRFIISIWHLQAMILIYGCHVYLKVITNYHVKKMKVWRCLLLNDELTSLFIYQIFRFHSHNVIVEHPYAESQKHLDVE